MRPIYFSANLFYTSCQMLFVKTKNICPSPSRKIRHGELKFLLLRQEPNQNSVKVQLT